jgi:hypothetical protein
MGSRLEGTSLPILERRTEPGPENDNDDIAFTGPGKPLVDRFLWSQMAEKWGTRFRLRPRDDAERHPVAESRPVRKATDDPLGGLTFGQHVARGRDENSQKCNVSHRPSSPLSGRPPQVISGRHTGRPGVWRPAATLHT